MNKDDYVVLKHIVDLIPTLDLSDDNNYKRGSFNHDLSLSVFAVDRNTYIGYNTAGAIIFSSIDKTWSTSILAPIANYGTDVIDDDIVRKMKNELHGLYVVKLDTERKRALITLIDKYKVKQKEERAATARDTLTLSMLDRIKGK